MRVLVACEFSGVVRDAFRAHGHDAVSCDLLPSDEPGPHYRGDVFDIIGEGWDLMIAHPPCTHLAVSGARWFKGKLQEQADKLSCTACGREYPVCNGLPDLVPVDSSSPPKSISISKSISTGWEMRRRSAATIHTESFQPCIELRIIHIM